MERLNQSTFGHGRRARWLIPALLMLFTGLILGAPPTLATVPEDVVFVVHSALGCPLPTSCVFEVSGAITDRGTVTTEFVRATALPSPVVGTAQYVRTFHGQAGSLTLRLESMITGTDIPWLAHEVGHWVVVSGSGPYAGLLGQGREEGTRDFLTQSLDVVYTGQVH